MDRKVKYLVDLICNIYDLKYSVKGKGKDMVILIDCFIIVVIGGLGSISGAFLGSIIFGLVTAFGILIAPRLAIAFGFILMIVVLIIRPWGLMGKPE